MTKPFKKWTVLPHGKLHQLDDNLLSVVGELHMPIGDFPRRMTVVKLRDGKLVIFSAIALDEPEMQALETFGKPSYLIVPNDIHRLDARIWKDRYPTMTVIAPAGVKHKVEEVVPVDATTATFDDPAVELVTVPGTNEHEAALIVRSSTGTTLVINDLIWNVDPRPGLRGRLWKLLGLTSEKPKIPTVVKLRAIKDKAAVHAQLEAWSQIPDLHRILVSHGGVVTREPGKALHELATQLAA